MGLACEKHGHMAYLVYLFLSHNIYPMIRFSHLRTHDSLTVIFKINSLAKPCSHMHVLVKNVCQLIVCKYSKLPVQMANFAKKKIIGKREPSLEQASQCSFCNCLQSKHSICLMGYGRTCCQMRQRDGIKSMTTKVYICPPKEQRSTGRSCGVAH